MGMQFDALLQDAQWSLSCVHWKSACSNVGILHLCVLLVQLLSQQKEVQQSEIIFDKRAIDFSCMQQSMSKGPESAYALLAMYVRLALPACRCWQL